MTSTVTDTGDDRDPLDAMAEEFLVRLRRGEPVAVSEYAARIPEQADDLRELLSALMMVEGLKPRREDSVGFGRRFGRSADSEVKRLGDFQILREIGRGGMGVVYEAEQVSLGRRVALKVLSPAVARTTQQVQRFLREARSAAQLHHTNIVPVFGVGDQDGLYYYAMQFIGGQGLDKVLDEIKRHKEVSRGGTTADATRTDRPADPVLTAVTEWLISSPSATTGPIAGSPATTEEAPPRAAAESSFVLANDSDRRYALSVARIGVQVADALEYAHRQGTVHRDIKPSNLLLDPKGNVWVADFGLAKATEDEDLTQTGDLVGTLRYMAPERFRGLCDARSDVHALGLTLYELVALRPAFETVGRAESIYQLTELEPPRLRSIVPAIPRDLETIIHKAIERDADHRYQSAGAMADDLRCFLEHRPIEARRVGSTERLTRWARRNPGLATLGTAVAGLLALTCVIIAIADVRLRRKHAETLFNLRRAESAEAVANGKVLESSLVRARAGRLTGIAGRRFDGLGVLESTAPLDHRGDRTLDFRNEAIACLALADLRPSANWCDTPERADLGFDFAPAMNQIAIGTAQGDILIKDPTGQKLLATLPGEGLRPGLVRFSPDGRYLAAKFEREGRFVFVVFDLATRRPTLKLPDGVHTVAFDFHPDGHRIATGRRDGSIVLHDLATGREVGQLSPGTVPQSIRFDPAGKRLAVASPNSDQVAQVREVDGGRLVAEWRSPEGARSVAWHPDGRSLAVGGFDGSIHLLDPDQPARPPRRLVGHGGSVVSLAFHPTDDFLASASWDGTLRVWDARSAREVVRTPLPDARPLRFSHDGRFLGPGHDGTTSWLWELADGKEWRSIAAGEGAAGKARSLQFLGPDDVLVSAGSEGVRLESLGREASAFAAMPGTAGAAVAPDGSFLLTGGSSGLLRWPVSRPSPGELRIGPPSPVEAMKGLPTGSLKIGRDGRTLAVVADDERGRVTVLDLAGERPPVEIAARSGIDRIDLDPDGRWIATGAAKGGSVEVWDARDGTRVANLDVPGTAEVAFSPDGRSLVTGSGTEYRLWATQGWTSRRKFPRSQAGGQAGRAAFSPDGRTLALAVTRTLVQMVDVETGSPLATFEPPESRDISALGFSPDGKSLAVASTADAIQIWDLDTIRRDLAAMRLDWATPPVGPATISDGRRLAIGVEPAPWLGSFQQGEAHAQAGRWKEAAASYLRAVEEGAPGVDPWGRLAMARLLLGDQAGYRDACRHILATFGSKEPAMKSANNIAWSCALGPAAIDDYARVIAMAEAAASSLPTTNRFNTLGAVLYRAGRHEEAIRQLQNSVASHGAGGTHYDALFFAMAHHRLGHPDEARDWLRRAHEVAPIAMRKPDSSGPSSWIPRIEIEHLRSEASALIDPSGG